MKVYQLLILILVIVSCKQAPDNATFITQDIYVVFPDSTVEMRQYTENVTLYAVMNDSVECKAAVAENDDNMYADSVSTIQGVDANIFKFVETQQGYDLVTKDTLIDGIEAISFNYKNDFRGSSSEYLNEGYFIYHKNLMIMVEYSNRADLESYVSQQKIGFLNSIKIK